MNLEQQLRNYAEFLDAESRAHTPDHIYEPEQGDVTVVDLLERTERAVPESEGGWGRRMPVLVAAAAAILLVIAVAFFLPESSSEPVDTVDIPDEQVDVPEEGGAIGENTAVDENTTVEDNAEVAVSDRLMESAGAELPDVFADVLDPDVAVTVDGFEFPTPAGFDWLTDQSMAPLVDIDVSGCEGTGTVRCDLSLDFPFLDGNAVPQLGTLEYVEVDGSIVEYTSTTTNLEEAVEGLSLYRGWAIVNGVEDELFTPLGTIGFNETAAASHERLAPQFLEDVGATDEQTRISNLVSAAVAGGHTATLEELFDGPRFSWDFNGLAGSTNPTALISTLTGPAYEDIQQSIFGPCTFPEPTTMSCAATVTQRHAPDMAVADEIITMTLEDGFVTSWRVETLNVEEYFAGLGGYSNWVFANHPLEWEAMFVNEGSYKNTARSAELHAELAPLYNETLLG